MHKKKKSSRKLNACLNNWQTQAHKKGTEQCSLATTLAGKALSGVEQHRDLGASVSRAI